MFARRKGRAGEQELRRLLTECFGDLWSFERNSFQSRMGGDDMATDAPYSFECKRVEKPSWGAWIKQAVEQARRHLPPKVPVIAHRPNGGEWSFTLQVNGREFARIVRAVHMFNQLPQETQLRILGGKGLPISPPTPPLRLPAADCVCGCPASDHEPGTGRGGRCKGRYEDPSHGCSRACKCPEFRPEDR